MAQEVAPGVFQIDTRLGGWEQVTAGYLVDGSAPVLVETGSQTSVPILLEALSGHGIGPSDLAGVVVTHIHLDHAGGVGDVAAAFPSATVYVHPEGARHLVDPTKLVASAARVYGDLLDRLYGRLTPTASERIQVLEDGDVVPVGPGRSLTAVDSPGHARHHLGLHDSETGTLFAGDAVGVRLPGVGVLRPAAPPPDFDLELALGSLRRFAARRPSALALAHYGVVPGDPAELLDEAAAALHAWAAAAEAAWREGADVDGVAEALAARFSPDMESVPEHLRQRVETLNGVHSNAAGLRRWLEKGGTVGPPPG